MPPKLKLAWATHEAAKFACENWHYSGRMPAGKIVKIGVWENDEFKGVILFSRGASPFLLKRYGISQYEGCELTRVAMRSHDHSISKMVSIAIKMLSKSNPGLKLIVSFADPNEGHVGGIYQAGNWIYTGETGETVEWFIDGKYFHTRGAYANRNRAERIRRKVPKYRYLYPLDSRLKKMVESLRKPYPKKRVGSKETVATPDQGVEASVNLSPTLHSKT